MDGMEADVTGGWATVGAGGGAVGVLIWGALVSLGGSLASDSLSLTSNEAV